jgi:hypothetical protein
MPTGDLFAGLSAKTMMEFFPDEYRRRQHKSKKSANRTSKNSSRKKQVIRKGKK